MKKFLKNLGSTILGVLLFSAIALIVVAAVFIMGHILRFFVWMIGFVISFFYWFGGYTPGPVMRHIMNWIIDNDTGVLIICWVISPFIILVSIFNTDECSNSFRKISSMGSSNKSIGSSNSYYENEVNSIKAREFGFVDCSGIYRRYGDSFVDHKGNWCKWGESFYDYDDNYIRPGGRFKDSSGTYRKWGDDFIDSAGNYIHMP